ncbi:Mini-ribonuclease 3 [Haliovirga abyssi]|uniref:Mini-ribonuclease 3 n=1 Tax=Haliovirga abyssi TaxID=2996794 RepID=A0AAU9DCW2_9FUSO|nr:ribonuclease III domain-containing protein [Haliovirga abyssi]BDU51175.1 mini-ribonuclease 3-like protein [Haliovirga abyssi]
MGNSKLKELSSLALAYLGDSIWELHIREYFVMKNYKVGKLNNLVGKYVNAKSQNIIFEKIFENLPEEEKSIALRARNAKIKSYPKSCTQKEYKNATALEALVGYYYLNNEKDKVNNLIEKYIIEGEKNG